MLKIRDLHREHDVVCAARSMVRAYATHSTMIPSLEAVAEEYPNIPKDYLICLWIGVNAEAGEGSNGDNHV